MSIKTVIALQAAASQTHSRFLRELALDALSTYQLAETSGGPITIRTLRNIDNNGWYTSVRERDSFVDGTESRDPVEAMMVHEHLVNDFIGG